MANCQKIVTGCSVPAPRIEPPCSPPRRPRPGPYSGLGDWNIMVLDQVGGRPAKLRVPECVVEGSWEQPSLPGVGLVSRVGRDESPGVEVFGVGHGLQDGCPSDRL